MMMVASLDRWRASWRRDVAVGGALDRIGARREILLGDPGFGGSDCGRLHCTAHWHHDRTARRWAARD